MASILSVTIPFFALVLCGYLPARLKLLPGSAIPGLNIYVLYFALPCMLYRFGASLPVAQLIDASVIAVWLTAALVMVLGTIALTRSARVGPKDAAFGALTVAWTVDITMDRFRSLPKMMVDDPDLYRMG